MSTDDPLCLCACRRSRHKRVMRWGKASYGRCLECSYCDVFEPAAATEPVDAPASAPLEEPVDEPVDEPAEEPASQPVDELATEPDTERATELASKPGARPAEVLGWYRAWLCRSCGARYGQDYPDHGCGPLVPVTVTITLAVAGEGG